MPKALGLVETRGLVAAIEAADAMVKTSNVTLIGKEVTKPALITIKIVGDVAAVKASVDAGAAAAAKVGELVSTHVIPQPDSQMTVLFPEIKDDYDPGGGGRPKPERKKKTDQDKPSYEVTSIPEEKDFVVDISTPEEKDSVADISVKEAEPQAGKTISEEKQSEAASAAKPSPKAPVSKPVKSHAPKPKKEQEGENLFSPNLDHLERLRREALGIKEPKEEPLTKQSAVKSVKKSTSETSGKPGAVQNNLKMEELEKLNVHNLRKAARAMEGFPIQGREISRANRTELLDLFKKII